MNVALNEKDADMPTDSELSRLIGGGTVRSFFQPILDIARGQVLGFEALSRGPAPLESPEVLFGQGHREGLTWELEALCRSIALKNTDGDLWCKEWRLFLNVSPSVFMDRRFPGWLTGEFPQQGDRKPSAVVLELTETEKIEDFDALSRALLAVRSMGFQVALDDLGSGNAGLPSLVKARPDFIKLDRFLVQDIHRDIYRQDLIRACVDFAGQVSSVPIAEGVEKWEELECLAELGIRFFQGFLLGRPAPVPTSPADAVCRRAKGHFGGHLTGPGQGDSVKSLVRRSHTVHPQEMTGDQIDLLFRKNPDLDHVVVIREDRIPMGLVTRQDFFRQTGGAFGYHLFQRQPVISLAKKDFLTVPEEIPIQTLSKKAMERSRGELYDPVMVLDDEGRLSGTVTMKQIISRSSELEVERALSANPLTGLPGNRHIEKWIMDNLQPARDFTIIYADLDRFKEYNDRYGFIQGDRLICFTGDVLRRNLETFPAGTKLGHVGGDDFVFVCPGFLDEEALKGICETFDSEKNVFFSDEDRARGFYEAEDRRGNIVRVRLVTLSLAAVESRRLGMGVHPAELTEIAAALKHRVKQITSRERKSAFCFERRTYANSDVWSIEMPEESGPINSDDSDFCRCPEERSSCPCRIPLHENLFTESLSEHSGPSVGSSVLCESGLSFSR